MPIPKALTGSGARSTLANRLGPRVDRLRQIATRLGVRSRRAFLVWTKFTGEERGAGEEKEFLRVEILPTPRVADLNSIALNPFSAGVLPAGSLKVDRISVLLTEDQLTGRIPPVIDHTSNEVKRIEEPFDFFWEIVEDGRGDGNPPREKFRLAGHPWRHEGGVEWCCILERVSEDRGISGVSLYGTGL